MHPKAGWCAAAVPLTGPRYPTTCTERTVKHTTGFQGASRSLEDVGGVMGTVRLPARLQQACISRIPGPDKHRLLDLLELRRQRSLAVNLHGAAH